MPDVDNVMGVDSADIASIMGVARVEVNHNGWMVLQCCWWWGKCS